METIVVSNNEYISVAFWDKIIKEKYEVIILNFEDDFEFMLTMYLRNIYKHNQEFLDSLVNILHDTINYKLLNSLEYKNSVVLSEKIVGEFISQTLFNSKIVHIFDELTHSRGNEFYILEKHKYEELFSMNIENLKINLLHNNMIYIGVMKDSKFIANYHSLHDVNKIVVLSEGK